MQTTSAFPECEHVKSNGIRCGSPALRGAKLCFFHHPAAREAHRMKQVLLRPHPAKIAMRDLAGKWPARANRDQRGLLTYALNLMMGIEPLSAAEELALRSEASSAIQDLAPSHFFNKPNVP
jgi:hypothetical protein